MTVKLPYTLIKTLKVSGYVKPTYTTNRVEHSFIYPMSHDGKIEWRIAMKGEEVIDLVPKVDMEMDNKIAQLLLNS